jgi:hypothetical protein
VFLRKPRKAVHLPAEHASDRRRACVWLPHTRVLSPRRRLVAATRNRHRVHDGKRRPGDGTASHLGIVSLHMANASIQVRDFSWEAYSVGGDASTSGVARRRTLQAKQTEILTEYQEVCRLAEGDRGYQVAHRSTTREAYLGIYTNTSTQRTLYQHSVLHPIHVYEAT